jgi:hypothetical protein
MLHLACHLSPRPLPRWITNPTPYAAHPCDFNLTTTRRSRSIDKFSGEYCEFLFGQQFNHETCCPWPTIFCDPSLWIANPTPPPVPSHNVNKMTNKTDSGQFPFPVRWVWSFLFNNYLKRDAPHVGTQPVCKKDTADTYMDMNTFGTPHRHKSRSWAQVAAEWMRSPVTTRWLIIF